MARIHELIRQLRTTNESLANDLEREFDVLSDRRAFGLNFERHTPEAVELPGRPVRTGDKVHILPPRGEKPTAANSQLWRVTAIERSGDKRLATLEPIPEAGVDQTTTADVADLVVVAEFRDPIYPGLVSTGKVERGGDKPFHTVINSENYHALQTLLFTHRGRVDAIYIDPPYNTGAKDWKYNNDYVEGDDLYRHSKWLAFMERRLLLAKELLNPDDSVLIVTIDEKEYLRLGLLLEQTFPDAHIYMVTSAINFAGSSRQGAFGRSAEYLFFVSYGAASPAPLPLGKEWNPVARQSKYDLRWADLPRAGDDGRRSARPNMFYPIFASDGPEGPVFRGVGDPYLGEDYRSAVTPPEGAVAIWPIRRDGSEGRWNVAHTTLRTLIGAGFAKLGVWRDSETWVGYLKSGEITKIKAGNFPIIGHRADGSVITDNSSYVPTFVPTDIWRITSHDAGNSGSHLLRRLLPGRHFPFPKSLYAVEDTIRFFVGRKPNSTVVDFFAGSGTTAHAIMRLNKQDGGERISVSVTNNEVSNSEHNGLRERGLRPGDPDWERWGICEYITKPRIETAIAGRTPEGESVKGDYKFTDEYPMAEGLEENVEFFNLTYEAPIRVQSHREFGRIAPLLWLRAGSRGRRIESLPNGWDVADAYGVIADLDRTDEFLAALAANSSVQLAFIVTDEDRLFEAIVRDLPPDVEPVRLYASYLRNFEIDAMRGVR